MVRENGLSPDMLFELIKAMKKDPMAVPSFNSEEMEDEIREE